jgi:hypothetical protein
MDQEALLTELKNLMKNLFEKKLPDEDQGRVKIKIIFFSFTWLHYRTC